MNHQRNPGEVGGVCNLNWERPEDSLGSETCQPSLLYQQTENWRCCSGETLKPSERCNRRRGVSFERGRDRESATDL